MDEARKMAKSPELRKMGEEAMRIERVLAELRTGKPESAANYFAVEAAKIRADLANSELLHVLAVSEEALPRLEAKLRGELVELERLRTLVEPVFGRA